MGVQINGSEGNVIATKGTYSGNVTIGGTLTYEDVTNIDSVGLVTARTGIEIGARPGVAASISVDGNMIVSGISTFGGDVQVPDKIIHSGDTNTAIRFPTTDNVSVETNGSESIRFDDAQRIIKGHTATYAVAGHYPSVQLTGTTFNDATLGIINNANDATGAYIQLSKQRSGSPTGATIVQDDDLVGQIGWTAGDGTDVTSRIAEIKGFVDGTPGSNDTPGRLSFWTTADGAQSATERLRIDSKGQLSSGGSTTAFGGTSSLNGLQMYYETDSGLASFGSYSSGGSTNLAFLSLIHI